MKLRKESPVTSKYGFEIRINPQDITGMFVMMCPNRNSQCGVSIIKGAADEATGRHGWDGNKDEPTITPSIGCTTQGRCGFHGNVIKGVREPEG